METEVSKRIIHINATEEFKNNPEKINLLYAMCEIADRKQAKKTIIETHFNIETICK